MDEEEEQQQQQSPRRLREMALPVIVQGCRLAKELIDSNDVPSILESQPGFLLQSCQEIAALFNKAVTHLLTSSGRQESPPPTTMSTSTTKEDLLLPPPPQTSSQLIISTAGTSSSSFSYDHHHQATQLQFNVSHPAEASQLHFARRSSRKRKDSKEKIRFERVAAPRTGNLNLPPDDGYAWRKYGQKEILGSRFPRSYYRCTHNKLCGCEAKKHVQRVDEDPFMLEVTYWGNHSCKTSPTPLLLPPSTVLSVDDISNNMVLLPTAGSPPSPLPSTSIQLATTWPFSPEKAKNIPDDNNRTTFPLDHEFLLRHYPMTMTNIAESSSTSRGEGMRELQPPVSTSSDLADMIFYFPSSSNMSMDTIFSSKHD